MVKILKTVPIIDLLESLKCTVLHLHVVGTHKGLWTLWKWLVPSRSIFIIVGGKYLWS